MARLRGEEAGQVGQRDESFLGPWQERRPASRVIFRPEEIHARSEERRAAARRTEAEVEVTDDASRLDAGVRGLIAVNRRAGGHAGPKSAEQLMDELGDLGLPLVCAGGIGDAAGFVAALRMGYAGAQLGTRFIATTECTAHADYKRAIVAAGEDDIVLTERVTGVPLAVIRTPYVERVGTKAGPIARWLLRHRRTKHLMRTLYALHSAWRLKRRQLAGPSSRDYWQAGKSGSGITSIESAGDIVRRFTAAARAAFPIQG